jgi:hypothetical protein
VPSNLRKSLLTKRSLYVGWQSCVCSDHIYTGCLKIREFRIQSVVGKDPVELEKYLEKKIALPEEHISTLILFNR